MIENLRDKGIGLEIRNDIDLIPNKSLSTLIGMYSKDVVSDILEENPSIVDGWLAKLHKDFILKKSACEIQNDTTACFDMKGFEVFERNYNGWINGGYIKIMIDKNNPLWVCKNPVKTKISLKLSNQDSMSRNNIF
ncbi:MAG: hypothetical protein DA328_06630 [Nitrososphaeraceae archaeon]|nr:hypothetical protein [Nitrososphaeraceae archaeon]